MSSEVNEDAAVRTTDQDALLSRFSAHTLGYIRDPHSAAFVSPAVRRSPATARRPPLINLGTHARTCAIDELVRSFILAHQQHGAQVVSLGAGTDTRFWRLRDEWDAAHRPWNLAKWLEVDFQEATAAKSRIVTTKAELKSRLGDAVKLEQGGSAIHSSLYALLPLDLRSPPAVLSSVLSPHLSPTRPTLLLTECVLIYLPSSNVSSLLSWFTATFRHPHSAIASYDPFGLHDSFGQVMRRNLATRGLTLPSALDTPTLESLQARLRQCGFSGPDGCRGALTVAQVRSQGVIEKQELARVNAIEQIDEVEELNLVLGHYAITWATRGPSEGDEEANWKWNLIKP